MKITDKVRLDWLCETKTSLFSPRFRNQGRWSIAPSSPSIFRHDLRKAIDEAIYAELSRRRSGKKS